MRIILSHVLLLVFSASLSGQKYQHLYLSKLEKGSKLIEANYNYTFELTADGQYLFKRYYPPTKMITEECTYKSAKKEIKHGPYVFRFDDGTVVFKGEYLNDDKHGQWIDWINNNGAYENGSKQGEWKYYRNDSKLWSLIQYKDDQLHGEQIYYDTLGHIMTTAIFHMGELISGTPDSTTHESLDRYPTFGNCTTEDTDSKIIKECSDKRLLEHVYKNLKYPRKARRNNVEGRAYVQFVVDKTGKIKDIEVRSGISPEIKLQCLNLVKQMPSWSPGWKYGEPVDVQYTLPVTYRLEN